MLEMETMDYGICILGSHQPQKVFWFAYIDVLMSDAGDQGSASKSRFDSM